MTKQPPRTLADTKAAAEFMKIPPGTLANWRLRNFGPSFFKVGHAVRYDMEDLMRWLERNRVEPQDQER